MPNPRIPRMQPSDPIRILARSRLLDDLSGTELVIYLRLLAEVDRLDLRRVTPTNRELAVDDRTAVKALARLEELRLIKIDHQNHLKPSRRIEVLR